MSITQQRLSILLVFSAAIGVGGIHISAAQSNITTGPSSSRSPYVVPTISSTGINNDFSFGPITFGPAPTVVPEPATMTLLGIGLAGIAAKARKRRRREQL